MKYTFVGVHDSIAYIEDDDVMITDGQSALDLMMTMKYETNCNMMILGKKSMSEDFFVLRNGIAGEILQKFINYQIKLAVVGDFSGYESKALKDFMYECNNGNSIFFAADFEEGIKMLEGACN